jgi:glycosyltransferase involved in cell wall biosynthesis
MSAATSTVCLNMIVKNEAPVIRRCLDSVLPLIDSWVIVDTGSTDGTGDVIRDHLRHRPGELHERPWKHFAHNRSEALALARDRAPRADYIMVIDADEVLEIAPDFVMPPLTADSYTVQVLYGGCTYLRRQLLRSVLPWRYEGVLHEYVTCEAARSEGHLSGLRTIPHHDGARARDPLTYRRDALLLEQALLEEPANTRYVFYLAQSYRDAGDYELATRHYKRRVEMGGWPEEIWYSQYQIAMLQERRDQPWPEVMDGYLAAWKMKPDRAGPLYRIGMHYQARGEYHLSHLFFARAITIPMPGHDRLFVEQALYDCQLPIEYAVACYYVGDHAAAIATNNRLLRSGRLPAHAIDQVVRNRRFSLDALFPPPSPPAAYTGPLRVILPVDRPGPELDDCVESLRRQDTDALVAAILTTAADHDSVCGRVPRDDARLVVVRDDAASAVDELSRAVRHARAHAHPDDVLLLLTASDRLSDATVLTQLRAVFGDAGCSLAYGQHRRATGELGDAEAACSAEDLTDRAATLSGRSPLAVRASLLTALAGGAAPTTASLLRAATFSRTRFVDAVWTVRAVTADTASGVAAAAAASAPRSARADAPAVKRASLPSVSCLMVTLDRLALAKRAIRSWVLQSYPTRELVIVTDGEDAFRLALERFVAGEGIPRARVLHTGRTRLTLGALRNISLDAARGDLVCQWDDDDCSHPERLMTQIGEMMRQNAGASLLTDHFQFIEEQRALYWVDWTLGGTVPAGTAQLAPGTLLMHRDRRLRYPEDGPLARQGEDSVFLESVNAAMPIAPLSGKGYLYLYTYHGRNVFPREHHYRLSRCCTTTAYVHEQADRIREAVAHYALPRPLMVVGREGPAFAINS